MTLSFYINMIFYKLWIHTCSCIHFSTDSCISTLKRKKIWQNFRKSKMVGGVKEYKLLLL